MSHKTDPDADLLDLEGEAVPGHYAGCDAIGIDGPPGQRYSFLEDAAWCSCGGTNTVDGQVLDGRSVKLTSSTDQ